MLDTVAKRGPWSRETGLWERYLEILLLFEEAPLLVQNDSVVKKKKYLRRIENGIKLYVRGLRRNLFLPRLFVLFVFSVGVGWWRFYRNIFLYFLVLHL